jgi:restriction endonuclease S subunit
MEVRKGSGNNYFVYAICNDKCTEHFWFCNAKFTLYGKEEDEADQRKLCSTEAAYVFYGANSMLIGSTILSRNKAISFSLEVDILRAQPKYV